MNIFPSRPAVLRVFVVFLLLASQSWLVQAQSQGPELCQYAISGSATSNAADSEAVYATGAPDADNLCSTWSGKKHSWNPSNWNVKANLTLQYQNILNVTNLTIFGDYDICYSRIWLLNTVTGNRLQVFSGVAVSCNQLITPTSAFSANAIQIETCGWGWSSTDAVRLCGATSAAGICGNKILEGDEQCDDGNALDKDGCSSSCKKEIVAICNWQNCASGAVSFSTDDSFTSCKTRLDSHNLKGTFYLMKTNNFTSANWSTFLDIYRQGHEIGAHTEVHACALATQRQFASDLKQNVDKISAKIPMKAGDFTTMSWPCGVTNASMQAEAMKYFIAARGYHHNLPESITPSDYFDLNNINTPAYGTPAQEPPNLVAMADSAVANHTWINYVFHNSCADNGVIDYVVTKDLWVSTVRDVVKYAKERDNAIIGKPFVSNQSISFNLSGSLNATIYSRNISLNVFADPRTVRNVKIDGKPVPFTSRNSSIVFNLNPAGSHVVSVLLENTSLCGNYVINQAEQCDDGNVNDEDGCSSECKIEDVQVYFVPYLGDIDGSIDPGWYYFYEKMRRWHEDNRVKGSFSLYPDTMNDPEFNQIIGRMHAVSDLELITKGESQYGGIDTDLMSLAQVKSVLGDVQNKFVLELTKLNYTNVSAPTTYNQQGAMFTETIRNATRELGFNLYLEQYVSRYGYVPSMLDYDITQYSVSLSVSGLPGAAEAYKKPDQVIGELIAFNHSRMIYVNGIKVVPLLSHQQDFRISENSNILNQSKFDTYTTLLLKARKDPRIALLKPQEVYKLRHGNPVFICGNAFKEGSEQCDDGNNMNGDGCSSGCVIEPFCGDHVCGDSETNANCPADCVPVCGNLIVDSGENCDDGNSRDGDGCNSSCRVEAAVSCVFATAASATSSNAGSEPIFATGSPDSDDSCSVWGGTSHSWNPLNWDVKANLTVRYPTVLSVSNFTIFGDYDVCYSRLWLINTATGTELLVFSGNNNACRQIIMPSSEFSADAIRLETCGWGWSSTDAVQLCGVVR